MEPEPCQRGFASEGALYSHYANSSNHAYCILCRSFFDLHTQLRYHQEDEHWACDVCDRIFQSELGRHEHSRQSHPYCTTHRRAFHTPANLNAHLNGSEHVQKNQPCPFRCGRMFVDRSAVVLHLEQGACPSGVNRTLIDNYLRANDRNRFITTSGPRLLLEGPAPTSTYIATERSWDHSRGAYVCVLCHGKFTTLRGLNAHLASPRHAYANETSPSGEKLYKCPSRNCARSFATLSGVVQHAEYGNCGVLQQAGMSRMLDGVIGDTRRLTY
ncbi:hypothetical protein JCM8202_001273 [Rhodotorula sphaerocarpa]